MLRIRRFRIALTTGLLLIAPALTVAAQQTPSNAELNDTTLPASVLLQPLELQGMLTGSDKPVVLQVGSHILYAEAHIPGSEYVGAVGTAAGAEALRAKVAAFSKDQLIVLYCGCCPWGRCPNIRPGYEQLSALGFTRVKVLYLAENFGKNWVDKGFPIAKGR